MATAILRYGFFSAFLLIPIGASALTGDPAIRPRIEASDGTVLSPTLVRYWHASRWHGHILPLDFEKHCAYGKRWQPFPTDHGYAYACVPWR